MKDKLRDFDEDKITGFFDKDTEINGNLSFKGSFRIDGRFKGKINSDSILIIGEQGHVDAEIRVGRIIISGEIKGDIQAKEKIEIQSTGRVFGSIQSPKLVIDEGAYLEASCHTGGKPTDLPPIKEKILLEEKPA